MNLQALISSSIDLELVFPLLVSQGRSRNRREFQLRREPDYYPNVCMYLKHIGFFSPHSAKGESNVASNRFIIVI